MKKFLSYLVYWILQCTWGGAMTLIGAIVALILIITGHKPKTLGPAVYFETGYDWGGLELGGFFICCKNCSEQTKYHELGHGIQNIVWGPLFPFVIWMPSALRYWLRTMPTRMKMSIFNLFYFLGSLLFTTSLAVITGACCHLHWTTITIELFRAYFLVLSIWLSVKEIPKYNHGFTDYDEIWFEGQATRWGTKMFERKKED